MSYSPSLKRIIVINRSSSGIQFLPLPVVRYNIRLFAGLLTARIKFNAGQPKGHSPKHCFFFGFSFLFASFHRVTRAGIWLGTKYQASKFDKLIEKEPFGAQAAYIVTHALLMFRNIEFMCASNFHVIRYSPDDTRMTFRWCPVMQTTGKCVGVRIYFHFSPGMCRMAASFARMNIYGTRRIHWRCVCVFMRSSEYKLSPPNEKIAPTRERNRLNADEW